MFAKTYKPSLVPNAFKGLKESLEKSGKGRVARMLAVPPDVQGIEPDEELFPEWEEWLRLEKEGVPEKKLVDVGEDDDADAEGAEEAEEDGEEYETI
jgi:coatomer subunit beta'